MRLDDLEYELKKIQIPNSETPIEKLKLLAKKTNLKDYDTMFKTTDFINVDYKILYVFTFCNAIEDIDFLLKRLKKFMPYINESLVCDTLCQNFKLTKVFPNEVFKFISKYKNTKNEFESRMVSTMLQIHFLYGKYINKVMEILDKLNTEQPCAKEGVVNAFLTISRKYPSKLYKYMSERNYHLTKETYDEILTKIVASRSPLNKFGFLFSVLLREDY